MSRSPRSCHTPTPGRSLRPVSMAFPLLGISHKWNHMIRGILCRHLSLNSTFSRFARVAVRVGATSLRTAGNTPARRGARGSVLSAATRVLPASGSAGAGSACAHPRARPASAPGARSLGPAAGLCHWLRSRRLSRSVGRLTSPGAACEAPPFALPARASEAATRGASARWEVFASRLPPGLPAQEALLLR